MTDGEASTKAAPPAAKSTPVEEVEFAHAKTCCGWIMCSSMFFDVFPQIAGKL